MQECIIFTHSCSMPCTFTYLMTHAACDSKVPGHPLPVYIPPCNIVQLATPYRYSKCAMRITITCNTSLVPRLSQRREKAWEQGYCKTPFSYMCKSSKMKEEYETVKTLRKKSEPSWVLNPGPYDC